MKKKKEVLNPDPSTVYNTKVALYVKYQFKLDPKILNNKLTMML